MLQSIILLVLTNIVSIGGWLFSIKALRRKANAEATISEADANSKQLDIVKQVVTIYQTLNDDIRNDYENRLKIFKDDIEDLKTQLNELQTLKCYNTSCANRQK